MTLSIEGLHQHAEFGDHTQQILWDNQSETIYYSIYEYASGWTNTLITDGVPADFVYDLGHSPQEIEFIDSVFSNLDPFIDLDFVKTTDVNMMDIMIRSVSDADYWPSDDIVGSANEFTGNNGSWWRVTWKDTSPVYEMTNEDRNTIVHEIGHALGLSHPFEDPFNSEWHSGITVMSYLPSPEGWDTFFSPTDILALQNLWGVENDLIA